MKPAAFDLAIPQTVSQACELLDDTANDSRVIAGGQTLMPILAMRVAQPSQLIDLSNISELRTIESSTDGLRVRAMVRQSALEDRLHQDLQHPALARVLPWIAHRTIRNRGTVCGSIAHADPSAELPLALTVLEGDVIAQSRKGRRIIAAKNFFQGALQTSLNPNELIYAVRFPQPRPGSTTGFAEFGYRHGDFAVVSVLVIRELDRWIFGFGGIDDTPKRFEVKSVSEKDATDYINHLTTEIDVREDPNATALFRRHLMRTLGAQAIQQTRPSANT